jgi:DNA mismatch repair protein MutS2
MSDPSPPKALSDLEWERVLAAVADRCRSPGGKRLASGLPFLDGRAAIETAHRETAEIVGLIEAEGEEPPRADLAEIDDALERVRISATLSREELRAVLAIIEASEVLRKYLGARKERAPEVHRACSTDPSLDDLGRELSRCFDPDGTLSDRASPRLRELRAEWRASRDRLLRRLEDLVRKQGALLSDTFWTERDGRYVLPVRSDAHERFPGIVHATSDSGATLFVEPRAIVPMGNRHKMLEGEVSREEEAVLAALSDRVGDQVESLAAAAHALAHADLRVAVAKLYADLHLSFPEIPSDEGEDAYVGVDLRAARHPLLLLDGVAVVASDLEVRAGHAMVVSGPNAGGKTVALKTMGLAALMVRAGLPVPAASGSRVSVFERVLTDVGDEQNLSKNLSTFSAHIQNLAGILDETRRGVLVLLDELAGGTDPQEGEALAAAILDSLCARGGAVACTTHYEALKLLALSDDRFHNAAVGFDLASMSPTFRLQMGAIGSSSALAVARRFGIAPIVVERAEKLLKRETLALGEITEKMNAERRLLELAREAAEREAETLRKKRAEVQQELERLGQKERGAITKEGGELLAQLRRAREELRAAQARLRGGKLTEGQLKAANQAIDAIGKKVAIGGKLEPPARGVHEERAPVPADRLRVGMRVYVPRIRAEAEVLEVMASGQLRVAAGPLKLLTTIDEIRAAGAAALKPSSGPKRPLTPFDAAADAEHPIQTSENTADLRGLRAHEAVAMAEQHLDRCLGAGLRVAFLIHGHGTGALRDALRSELSKSAYVARSRPADPEDGGDGVTVVWLR